MSKTERDILRVLGASGQQGLSGSEMARKLGRGYKLCDYDREAILNLKDDGFIVTTREVRGDRTMPVYRFQGFVS